MLSIAAIQISALILLLFWIYMYPAKQFAIFILQVIFIGLTILYIGMAGIWIIMPFWLVYLFATLFIFIVFFDMRKRSYLAKDTMPQSVLSMTVALIYSAAIVAMSWLIIGVLGASSPFGNDFANIHNPLSSGTYIVVQGGSNKALNAHFMTLDENHEGFEDWRGQSKGIDIVRINSWGVHSSRLLPPDPKQYYSFGIPVLAPCNGYVVAVENGIDDMQVPTVDRKHMLGNHVIVHCGDFYVVLAHFKKDSIMVAKGDVLKHSQKIAQIGNSGNSSEPHLHIHAQKTLPNAAPMSGQPMNLLINGQFYVRNQIIVIP